MSVNDQFNIYKFHDKFTGKFITKQFEIIYACHHPSNNYFYLKIKYTAIYMKY